MGEPRPLEEEELRVIPVRPGICYGVLGPVFLLFYRTAPAFEDLRARIPYLEEIRDRSDRGAFLSVIDGAHARAFPDHPTRQETKRQAQEFGQSIAAGAVVLEGGGVRESLIRSFVRGLLMLKRSPMPYHFADTVEEAVDHCLEGLGRATDPARSKVLEAVEVLRRKAAEGAPED
jgi:hypothetical protein